MAEQPALNRFYVASYAANDRDFPIVAVRLDPRVAGYRVPEDLSPHPDSKRYPNHVFTGSQPSNGDERVTHIYEILPSPYVPFTRYDDDLGPIQGRRRSVKNEGQVASLAADKRVTYEAREGSAIVYTEIEESWSIETDDDGNSLFPIRDRDFYDASRGPVQERRQLFVPTGEEAGSLENVNGVITQTSYEPYNEFLSVKIVQTYSVNGPQLIGKATDNDGQLVTVTTQRKAALDYIPPNPTATRTVEVSREDAESLVERIVDTPEIFTAKTFSVERPDPIPQKFRVAVPLQSNQEVVEGDAELPTLLTGEISRSEEQRNKFIKRITSTSRDQDVLPKTLVQKATDNDRQEVTITETLQEGDTDEVPTATKTVESEALGDDNFIIRKTEVPEVFDAKTFSKERPDPVPQKFRVLVPSLTEQENIEGNVEEPQLVTGEISKSEQQVNKFVKRISTTSRDETQLPQSVTQKTTTNEGLLASVSETLQSGDTSITPTATRSVQSEALGDGSYVVTITNLPKVFAGEIYSVERPDPLPQKFRVAARTLTTQQTLAGTADPAIDLSNGQLSKSEQQVTEFVKRTSVTSRDQTQLPVTLVQRSTDNDRQQVTVTETLQDAEAIEQNSATVTIQSEALGDGNYLVTKTEVPEVFSGETYRKTKEDITPQKFKAAQEDTVFEQNVEGIVNPNIELGSGEFAKSEQQINKFVKRVSTTSRVITSAVTLNEKVLTPQGQIGTRLLKLDVGDQSFIPSATLIDASVEALGDNRTVLSQTTVPSVFQSKTIRKTRLDLTPEKFRAAQADTVIEENIAGTISSPESITLGTGEFSKSEEQVTEFVKRVSTNTRDITAADTLFETIITPQGQIATRTLRLTADPQSIQPDALLIDGSIEALGDQRTIKTEVRVPNVFEEKSLSLEKPDVTPTKFRATVPSTVVERSIEGTVASAITLTGSEISKSERQVTEFVKRVRTEERDPAAEGEVFGQVYTTELGGGLAQVTERYGASVGISPAYGTVAAEKEALGDGKFATREVELASPPELTGQNYDEELDIVFPFTQQFVEPNTGVGDARTEVQPRDVFHSLKRNIDINEFRNAALNQNWAIGDFVNVSLPDRLTAVDIIKTVAISSGQAKGAGSTGWDSSSNSSCTIAYSVRPNIINGYSGTVTATRYVFFLTRESSTIDQIKNKIESINSSNPTISNYLNSLFSSNALSVSYWPNIKPEPVTITLNGGSITRRVSKGLNVISVGSAEAAGSGNANGSDNFDTNLQASVINIPATLHGNINFNRVYATGSPTNNDWYTYKLERSGNAELPNGLEGLEGIAETISSGISINSSEINFYPSSAAQTGSYASFPIGNYIVSVDSQSYKYGLVRITAVVAHITSAYV